MFVAPTVRKSKVTGELVAYRWTMPPDPAQLTSLAGDKSGAKLAQLVRRWSAPQATTGRLFQQPGTWWDDNTGPVPKGERHDKLVSYAGKLRSMTQTKNSLGISDLPSLRYRIEEAIVPTAKGDARVGQFVLDGEADRTVRDILGTRHGEEQDEKTRAEDYLKKALADGPRKTTEVEEEASQVHTIAKRTLDRARRALRIPSEKRSDGRWWISLPEHEGDLKTRATCEDSQGCQGCL